MCFVIAEEGRGLLVSGLSKVGENTGFSTFISNESSALRLISAPFILTKIKDFFAAADR